MILTNIGYTSTLHFQKEAIKTSSGAAKMLPLLIGN